MSLKYIIRLVIATVSLLILLILLPSVALGNDNNNEINLELKPFKKLFEIKNMKPGDVYTETFLLSNSGKGKFKYVGSAELQEGSNKLFEELRVLISNNGNVLYNGRLEGLEIPSRQLKSGGKEELEVRVEFPYHLGNDFQGLSCEVEFNFHAEGLLKGILPIDSPNLPETATMNFIILVLGLILFSCGSIIYFTHSRVRIKNI
ncbi:cell wall protein [Rossellomorea aquimaris]|uniref:Cell wall protein n=1 Tax=Rossellomorea aquimaris TaxID=189382 RepID=A0A5D4TRU5_9BACI|nr:cell wall protein [Rossellomorea aquimaris]TYS78447.1 cell wall protein [Rossellomorea aquimaris]